MLHGGKQLFACYFNDDNAVAKREYFHNVTLCYIARRNGFPNTAAISEGKVSFRIQPERISRQVAKVCFTATVSFAFAVQVHFCDANDRIKYFVLSHLDFINECLDFFIGHYCGCFFKGYGITFRRYAAIR